MDVHPPLAKLMITLFGWIAGFNGDFDFKEIGKDYLEPGVPYVAMRLFPALCGIFLAPTMFLTLKTVGCRTTTAILGAGMIIFGKLATAAAVILISGANNLSRERPSDPGPFDLARRPPDDRNRLHRPRLHVLYQPT